jgi:hypothetical protein
VPHLKSLLSRFAFGVVGRPAALAVFFESRSCASLYQDSAAYLEGEHKRPLSAVLPELVAAEGVDLGEVRYPPRWVG